ncbi:hypothetical protein ACQPZX_34465 [Actinoplanes sp. CA-142083]|uniref:hypothetical protein n=1 Tax=Actinoplanes sp. CA-142083 TaxID=3239903 RepID=UPI003D8F109C
MINHPYRRSWQRGRIAYAGVLLGVPVLLATAVFAGGRTPAVAPSPESATMWLASADGRLVRANALVDTPSAQIVAQLSFPAARSGVRLVSAANHLVAATADGSLTPVDTRTLRAGTASAALGGTVTVGGAQLFRVRDQAVDLIDAATLRPTATRPVASIVSWAAAPGALYAATAGGAVTRVDADDSEQVRQPGGDAPLLTGIADGVAGYDGHSIFVVRGTAAKTVVHDVPGTARGFGASPDGHSFALVSGQELVVVAFGKQFRRALPFAAGSPVIEGGVVHLPDPRAGVVRRFRVGEGLAEESALEFGHPNLTLDVHRNRQFLWFDDIRGPAAWAVHDGQTHKIVKYAAPQPRRTTAAPSPSPISSSPSPSPWPSISRSPTSSPSVSPSPSASPSRSPSRSRSPSPSRSPSRSPSGSPSPSEDPLERCGGQPTALRVRQQNSTGENPRIDVDICERATGGDEYWIVSHSSGQWFAKTEIHGEGRYTVHLLHGSGTAGQQRDFVIVAGRTSSGRTWLRENLAADLADDASFPRDDLAAGVETVSEAVASTS